MRTWVRDMCRRRNGRRYVRLRGQRSDTEEEDAHHRGRNLIWILSAFGFFLPFGYDSLFKERVTSYFTIIRNSFVYKLNIWIRVRCRLRIFPSLTIFFSSSSSSTTISFYIWLNDPGVGSPCDVWGHLRCDAIRNNSIVVENRQTNVFCLKIDLLPPYTELRATFLLFPFLSRRHSRVASSPSISAFAEKVETENEPHNCVSRTLFRVCFTFSDEEIKLITFRRNKDFRFRACSGSIRSVCEGELIKPRNENKH